MATFEHAATDQLDALWTTTTAFLPMLAASHARHKIFYHVRVKENLSDVIRYPDIEIFACSTNVYEHDMRHCDRQPFLAVGGVTMANYQAKTNYAIDGGQPFIVMGYGRIAERVKGTKYVVKACEHLYRKGYNIRLLLFDTALDLKWQQKLDAFTCKCPFDFVQNHPFERNSELFNRADCFVSAENPRYSDWNNTVAEAMACGLPVVSTSAGTKDLLIDGETGIRSARWVFCFERHIARLYRDETLRRRLGMAARQHVKQFDWNILADRILQHVAQ